MMGVLGKFKKLFGKQCSAMSWEIDIVKVV